MERLQDFLDDIGISMKMFFTIIIGVILFVILFLWYSNKPTKEEVAIEKAITETTILYEYSEDILRPVITEEKTIEELVEEIVTKQLGLDKNNSGYIDYGILKTQPLILIGSIENTGGDIPQLSALPKELKDIVNSEGRDYIEMYLTDFYKDTLNNIVKIGEEFKEKEQTEEIDILLSNLKTELEEQEKKLQENPIDYSETNIE